MASHKQHRGRLERLLIRRNEHPERIAEVDAEIRRTFERELCVLVLDMCGFSRLTLRHGIIHYLAMIQRMHQTVLPVIGTHGGRVVKTEADNVFASFDDVPPAIQAARAIHAELARLNAVLPADWDVDVGIGIGFGPLLAIGEHDLYGSEMNLASKLGEDTAEAGEILLTAAAHARAGREKRRFSARSTKLGKLSLSYFAHTR